MSLEHIVGTHNLPATLMTTIIVTMELGWYCTGGGWYEATELLGGSMVFQEALSENARKAKKPTA
jgi:hypothetical protein